MSAWIPWPGTISTGRTPSQSATASRRSLYACSGYIQAFSSSARTASRTPANGPSSPSFQFSFVIVARPCSAFSSSRLGPGSYGSMPRSEGRTRPLEPVGRCRFGRNPEGARQGREVGLGEVDGRRLAERVTLVLPEDSVAAVVDDEERCGEPVLPRRRQLLEAVEDAAVARHRQGGRAGQRGSGAERRWPGVAERARAERVQEPPRRERREVCTGPVGE